MNKNEIIAALLESSLLAETATMKDIKEFAAKFETATLSQALDIHPRLTWDKKGIYIPLIERTIAIEHIIPDEETTWQEATDYCEFVALKLPTKEEALILAWQWDEINAFLDSVGENTLKKNISFWTNTRSSTEYAWYWSARGWGNNCRKTNKLAVVPFFAI